MSTQTVERFASIDDSAFDVYEIRSRMFDTLNAIDSLLWIDLLYCDRLRGCPSYAAELLALDYARAIERNRPQTAEVLASFYHTDVRPFLNGYYLEQFDPQFPAQEKPVKPTVSEWERRNNEACAQWEATFAGIARDYSARKRALANKPLRDRISKQGYEESARIEADNKAALDAATLAYYAAIAEPTKEEFASVVIPPDAFGALSLAAD